MGESHSQLGNYSRICTFHHGQPFITIGPERFRFALFFLVINIISATIILVIINKDSSQSIYSLVFIVSLIFLDISWILTAFLNPGIQNNAGNQEHPCQFCENSNNLNFMSNPMHCLKCGICIQQRFHHCSFTGNCIGKRNSIAYHFMLLAIFIWLISLICTLPYVYYLL